MIGIVGAGLTGLSLGYELARRGVEHVVLEASDRPGGVIRSERVDGRVLEHGPQRARMTPALARLVAELGLTPDVMYAPEGLPLYVYADGELRRVGLSAGSLLAGDLLTPRGKLRLLLEPLTRRARADERVDAFLARKLGREAYARFAGPLYGSLTASDPADMIVGHSLGPLLAELGVGRSLLLASLRRRGEAPRAVSFRHGLQTLTDALAATASVRTRAPARGLRKAGGRWTIELEDGQVEADTVVLTCEAPAAARILESVAPDAAARIARLRYNPLAIVHLEVFDARLHGMGYQVGLGETLATRSVTWNESLFGRAGIHTAFLGGAGNPGQVGADDDALGRLAADEFRRVTGREARVVSVSRTAMPAWDASWAGIRELRLPEGIRAVGSWRSRPGMSGRLSDGARVATELTSNDHVGSVYGYEN